jgi:FtsP/CotA-like multicopper oxidase with cupredoxin domain
MVALLYSPLTIGLPIALIACVDRARPGRACTYRGDPPGGRWPMNRRRFLLSGAGSAAGMTSAARRPRCALAVQVPRQHSVERSSSSRSGPVPMNVTGRAISPTGINGQIPVPILRWREGDIVTLTVTNRLSEPSSIHWHGLRVPSPMDGVPGLSFRGIVPGETYVYGFPVHQSGTYWYHSHSGFQEQTGVYGADRHRA